MQTNERKRLVMIGIRRKGEKGFKTRIRKDIAQPDSDVGVLNRRTVSQIPKEAGTI